MHIISYFIFLKTEKVKLTINSVDRLSPDSVPHRLQRLSFSHEPHHLHNEGSDFKKKKRQDVNILLETKATGGTKN